MQINEAYVIIRHARFLIYDSIDELRQSLQLDTSERYNCVNITRKGKIRRKNSLPYPILIHRNKI